MQFLKALLLAVPLAGAAKVDYNGYKVFRVATEDAATLESQLEGLTAKFLMHTTQHADVAVSKESIVGFEALNYTSHVLNEDLGLDMLSEGELIAYEKPVEADVGIAAIPSISWFNAYHAYADHLTFLTDLQSAFSANSEIITTGTSFQGRALTGIHLWGSAGKGVKPAIFFNGNVHAREWITSMVSEYFAYQLVTGYNSDAAVTAVLNSYDFYIVPIVNPDGFVYTQTTDRMWRKNRQTRTISTAVGTDVNRNWPYQWTGSGSSTSPSSETYRGQVAGDTPENLGLRNYADALAAGAGLKLFVDWHSYSQLLLLPYGYSCTARVDNYDQQMTLAAGFVSAVAEPYGTQFDYGPTCETIYATNGGSNDYVQDVSGAEFAWAAELRDTGTYGFVLPANQILPSSIEIWDGLKYLFSAF